LTLDAVLQFGRWLPEGNRYEETGIVGRIEEISEIGLKIPIVRSLLNL